MANSAKAFQIGVDVSKHELVISEEAQAPFTLENSSKAIKAWLKSLPGRCQIAMEATNDFHMVLTEHAHAVGPRGTVNCRCCCTAVPPWCAPGPRYNKAWKACHCLIMH